MEFDGTLGLPKFGLREHRHAQLDRFCIQGVSGLIEFDAEVFVLIEFAGHPNEAVSQIGIDTPIADLAGIGQRVPRYQAANAHVIKLVALGTQAGFDIAQTFPIGQLGKGHAEKLVEACNRLDLVVPLVALDAPPEAVQGKMVDDLGENQFASRHVAAPVVRGYNPTQDDPEAEQGSSR